MGIKLKDILAISGKSGLYKFLKQGRNGIIVEELESKKRLNAHATAKISSLEDITIYTEGDEDKTLSEVMKSIYDKENGGNTIDTKKATNEEMKSYFNDILPEYDKERVYFSDLKKIFVWYNILHNLKMLEIEEQEEEKKDDEKLAGKQKADDKEGKEKTGEKKEVKKTASKPKALAKPKTQSKPKVTSTAKAHTKPAQKIQTPVASKNK